MWSLNDISSTPGFRRHQNLFRISSQHWRSWQTLGTLKDSLIRDRIVCGVSSDALRKQLLKERELTLHKAVQLCQIHESAERYSKEVSDQQEVNAVRQQASSDTVHENACMYCGRCHAPQKELCPAFGKRCSSCMKMHHFTRACRSTQQRCVNRNVSIVDHDEADMLQEDADIHVITQTKIQNEIHCTARVNTHEIRLKIDTGAKCNVLPLDLFKKVQKRETVNKAKAVNLVAYGGERFSTLGTVDQCKIGDTTRLLTFQALDRQATPILGLNDALQLNLVKLDKAVYEVDADAEDAFHQQVVTEYADLFDDQLGNLAARYTMRVDKSVTPVVKPARKIPQAMEKVKEELGNMVKKGVIVRETEPTEWVSQMVATRKKNGDIRIFEQSFEQRFEQSSQTTTSSYAYCRWCGLQTGECEGLFDVGCEGWILADQAWKTILSMYNVQYTIWEVQVSPHALWHQKCSSKPWKDFLKDIHAQSLSTTSSSGVLLKNMMPTSGKSWRELDRLAWSWTSANAISGREASPSWDTHSQMKVWSLTQRRQLQFETCQHQKTKQLFTGFSEWQTTWTSSSRTTVKKQPHCESFSTTMSYGIGLKPTSKHLTDWKMISQILLCWNSSMQESLWCCLLTRPKAGLVLLASRTMLQ